MERLPELWESLTFVRRLERRTWSSSLGNSAGPFYEMGIRSLIDVSWHKPHKQRRQWNGDDGSRTFLFEFFTVMFSYWRERCWREKKTVIETFNLVNQLKIGSLLQPPMPEVETTLSCSHVQIPLPHYHQTIQMANAVSTHCQQLSQKLTCMLIQINLVTNYS